MTGRTESKDQETFHLRRQKVFTWLEHHGRHFVRVVFLPFGSFLLTDSWRTREEH